MPSWPAVRKVEAMARPLRAVRVVPWGFMSADILIAGDWGWSELLVEIGSGMKERLLEEDLNDEKEDCLLRRKKGVTYAKCGSRKGEEFIKAEKRAQPYGEARLDHRALSLHFPNSYFTSNTCLRFIFGLNDYTHVQGDPLGHKNECWATVQFIV